eukprot:4152393-Pleurochrysis_carterae.AAC.1
MCLLAGGQLLSRWMVDLRHMRLDILEHQSGKGTRSLSLCNMRSFESFYENMTIPSVIDLIFERALLHKPITPFARSYRVGLHALASAARVSMQGRWPVSATTKA